LAIKIGHETWPEKLEDYSMNFAIDALGRFAMGTDLRIQFDS
jgi:hypothetical protein